MCLIISWLYYSFIMMFISKLVPPWAYKQECHKIRPDPKQLKWRGHIFILWVSWHVTICEISEEVPFPHPSSLVDVMSCKGTVSKKELYRTYCLLIKGTNTHQHMHNTTLLGLHFEFKRQMLCLCQQSSTEFRMHQVRK